MRAKRCHFFFKYLTTEIQRHRRVFFLCFSLCLCVSVVSFCLVFCSAFALEIPKAEGKIKIQADRLELDQRTERIKGEGHVLVQYEDLHFTSDRLDFSVPDGILSASGHVDLSPGSSYQIQSDSLRFDINSGLFSVQNSHVFLEPSYYFTARRIEQPSSGKINISNASYTACDTERPAWRLSFSSGSVKLNQSAKLKNIILRIKETPVFYFPYFWFPINQDKATGFLVPDFGRSDDLGYFIQNHFYWPLSDWTDLEFPLDYFEKRGFGTGVQYRYALTKSDSARLRAYGIYDKQQKRERGDFSLQLQQNLAHNTRGVADVTLVSDDDYYRDFRRETSKRYSQLLPSRVFVETSTDTWNGRVMTTLTRSLIEGTRYRKLPEIDLYTRLRSYTSFPLFLQWESSWANLQIDDPNQGLAQAQRIDLSPRIFYPLTRHLFTLTPSLSYRKTWYCRQDEQEAQNGDLYAAGLDLVGPKFYKSFSPHLNHTIYPRLNLNYETMDRERGDFGVDYLDRLEQSRWVSLSLINRLWEPQREWLNLVVSQKYSFQGDFQLERDRGRKKSGFTDFELDASAQPGKKNRFELKIDYDLQDEHTQLMDFHWSTGLFSAGLPGSDALDRGSSSDFFDLGWRYSRLSQLGEKAGNGSYDQMINSLRGAWQLSWPFHVQPAQWSARVSLNYDLENGSTIENQYSLTYLSGCWSVQLAYLRRFDGQQWNVKVNLESLGELGF